MSEGFWILAFNDFRLVGLLGDGKIRPVFGVGEGFGAIITRRPIRPGQEEEVC